MISKFINWQSSTRYLNFRYCNFISPFTTEYAQAVQDSTTLPTVDTVNSGGSSLFRGMFSFKRDYTRDNSNAGPMINIKNLSNPSIVKVAEFPSYTDSDAYPGETMPRKISGVKTKWVQQSTSLTRGWNACVAQFNYYDKAYIDALISEGAEFVWEYTVRSSTVESTTPTTYRFIYSGAISSDSTNTTETIGSLTTNLFYMNRTINTKAFRQNGMIVLEREQLRAFNLERLNWGSLSNNFVFMSFYIILPSTSTLTLKLSNLVLTESVDIYLDDNIKLTNGNLTSFNRGKKTGIVFPEYGDNSRSMDSKISLLNGTELATWQDFVMTNKDTPFYVLPFAHASSDIVDNTTARTDTTVARFNTINAFWQGFWRFDNNYGINNSEYDDYNLDIKLDEYK